MCDIGAVEGARLCDIGGVGGARLRAIGELRPTYYYFTSGLKELYPLLPMKEWYMVVSSLKGRK